MLLHKRQRSPLAYQQRIEWSYNSAEQLVGDPQLGTEIPSQAILTFKAGDELTTLMHLTTPVEEVLEFLFAHLCLTLHQIWDLLQQTRGATDPFPPELRRSLEAVLSSVGQLSELEYTRIHEWLERRKPATPITQTTSNLVTQLEMFVDNLFTTDQDVGEPS